MGKYRLEQRLTLADVSTRPHQPRDTQQDRERTDLGQPGRADEGSEAARCNALHHVRNYDVPVSGAPRQGRPGIEVMHRGTKKGHTYHLLAYDKVPAPQFFEPFLITITDESEVFPRFEHSGIEFLYMLEGKLEYRHGQLTYVLEPGDSLTFRGETPHGPERLVDVPIRFLAIINYGSPGGAGEAGPPTAPAGTRRWTAPDSVLHVLRPAWSDDD